LADDGLRAIFLEQRPALLRLLAARLGSHEDAKDALQDMWIRLDGLADDGLVAQPAAFLYRVANNLATDRQIAAARRGARDHAWHHVQPTADDLPDAERVLVARDALRVIEAAIADMPERMATALRLFRIERQRQPAIAAQLGISVSGVEKLLQRAYRIIHARIADAGEDVMPPYRQDDRRGHRS
jgi:RNA polymerase sigma-70 factor (ECF subfamily)